MTVIQLQELFEEFTIKQLEILSSKGQDYANDDALSNFKKVANLSTTNSEDPILLAINTKIVRLNNLLRGKKEPNNESIDDTIIDLANYAFLLYAIRKENN